MRCRSFVVVVVAQGECDDILDVYALLIERRDIVINQLLLDKAAAFNQDSDGVTIRFFKDVVSQWVVLLCERATDIPSNVDFKLMGRAPFLSIVVVFSYAYSAK